MLERTAASIEPCGFQRVLPSSSSKYSLKGRRRLHTGFWQNAAPDVELLDACSTLMRMSTSASVGAVMPVRPGNKFEPSLASTFVLDFLYPNWAAPSLRRLRATLVNLQSVNGEQRARALTTRLYSSSSDHKPVDSPPSNNPDSPSSIVRSPEIDIWDGLEAVDNCGEDAAQAKNVPIRSDKERDFDSSTTLPAPEIDISDELEAVDGRGNDAAQAAIVSIRSDEEHGSALPTRLLAPEINKSDGSEVNDPAEDAAQEEDFSIRSDEERDSDSPPRPATQGGITTQDEFFSHFDKRHKIDHRDLSGPDGLRQILTSQDDIKPYETVWSLYNGLDDSQKQEFRTDVVLYLSRSARPVEAWRVCELFSLYSIEEWTDDLVEAAVKARLMFQDLNAAQALFTTALEKRQLGKCLDPFIVYCFRKQNWELFFDAWALFHQHMPRFWIDTPGMKSPSALEAPGTPEPGGDSTINAAASEPVSPRHARPFIFHALAAFPDFEANFRKLWEFAVKKGRRAQAMQQDVSPETKKVQAQAKQQDVSPETSVRRFLKLVAARSFPFFSPKDAAVIAEYSASRYAYESLIFLCIERGWAKLAMETYRKYRDLPGHAKKGGKVSGRVMQAIIDVFYQQKDALGMQQLLEDWTNDTWPINMKSYQRFIAFYARQGDVATVKRLIKDYLNQHKWAKMDPSVISAFIQVHSAAGDCDAARRVLEEYSAISSVQPNTVHWNNLIQAYVKARDFDGAMSAFTRLCEENQPDQYSFGIVMGMAGTRGDLRLTLDLLRLAGELGVKANTAMMDTLVEAYCQNDRFEEAALLCAKTVKDRKIEGSRTALWNTLLHHHAKRRDLASVNRVLEYMTKNNVPYDDRTYGSLLQALVNCKQVHHAVHFLRVALRDGVFHPTDDHYVLIMSGFLQTGEGYLALKTNELIKNKFPDTTKRMTAIIKTLGQTKLGVHSRLLKLGNDRVQWVNRALWLFRESFGKESSQRKGHHKAAAEQYSQVIFMLIQLRDFCSIQEILSLYSLQFPARASQETMPIKLMLDMMLADFYERKFGRVKQVFNIALTRMEKAGKQSSTFVSRAQGRDPTAEPQLAPSFEYEMCDALKTMQRLFLETDDPQGLINMVEDVQRRGFKLDSKNWNIYVQALARMNKWQEAFLVCEKELMPAWLGWSHVRANTPGIEGGRLPIELRRLASNPRLPRPISYTLFVLMRVWMDLDRLKLWSSEAEKMMQKIKDDCPRTVIAVTETVGRDKNDNWVQLASERVIDTKTPEEREGAKQAELRRLARSEYPRRAGGVHMESLRRLARAELEQDEYEIIGDAFARDEMDSTPQALWTKKSIDDVKTPYPWRNTWTRGEGLQMRQSDKPLAPERMKEMKKHYFRRQRIEKAERSIQEDTDAEPSRPKSSPEEPSPAKKAVEPKVIEARKVKIKSKGAKAERKRLRNLNRRIYGDKFRGGRKKPPAVDESSLADSGPTGSDRMARPLEIEAHGHTTEEAPRPSNVESMLARHLEAAPERIATSSRREKARRKRLAKQLREQEEAGAGDIDDAFADIEKMVAQPDGKESSKSRDDDSEEFKW